MVDKLLLFVHVTGAIIAVGSNLTYGFWFAQIQRRPEQAAFVMRSLLRLDDTIANPAYGVTVIAGIALLYVRGWAWSLIWIWGTLVCLGLIAVVYVLFYNAPNRRLVSIAEQGDTTSAEFQALRKWVSIWGYVLFALALTIIGLMTTQPA